MAEHSALRGPGRPARVLQERDVGGDGRRVSDGKRLGAGHQLVPREGPGGRGRHGRAGRASRGQREPQRESLEPWQRPGEVDADQGLHRGPLGRPLDGRGRRVPDDGHPGAVVGQLALQLLRRVQRVVLHHDGAEPEHGVEGDDVLRAVGQDQGHPVACLDTDSRERGRGALHLVVELRVGGGAAEEVEGHAGAEASSRLPQQVDQ